MKKLLQAVGLNLLVLLLLVNNLYAVNPTFKYFGNTGGLNQKLIPILIADNECADATNVYFDEGSIIKRPGYTVLNAVALAGNPDITGLYELLLDSGTRIAMAASSDGGIWKMDGLDGTWDSIGAGFTADARYTFSTFILTAGTTIAIAMNGTDIPQYWDGAAGAVANLPDGVGTAPINQYQVVFKNRLFAAGNPTNPNRLYYTDVNQADDWTGGGTIEIDSNDGDVITGLVATKYAGTDIFDKLVIFKRNSIYMLDADDAAPANWVVSQISTNTGCISGWSIQNAENVILFLAYNGVYSIEGTVVTQISDRIDPLMRNIVSTRLDDAISVLNQDFDQYWLSVTYSTGTENNRIFVYDYLLNSWTQFTGISANAFWIFQDPTTQARSIYSGDYNGFVFRQFTGTSDNGAAITANYTTKTYTFGSIEWLKRVLYFYVYALASGGWDLTVEYSRDGFTTFGTRTVDLTAAGSLWGSFVWGVDTWGAESFIRSKLVIDEALWGIRLRFSNNTLNQDFQIYGWSFDVQPLQRDDY